ISGCDRHRIAKDFHSRGAIIISTRKRPERRSRARVLYLVQISRTVVQVFELEPYTRRTGGIRQRVRRPERVVSVIELIVGAVFGVHLRLWPAVAIVSLTLGVTVGFGD